MFDKRLKFLLESRNLSVSDLAKETAIPKSTLQGWLTGVAPNILQVDKLATYFNMTVDELVFGRKPKSSIESLLSEIHIHEGVYKVSISKLVKSDKEDS